eukprot:13169025-Alexandrium_andersonii.AAC.1
MIVCSRALPKPVYTHTPAARSRAPMSGVQMVPYTEAPRVQQLKSPNWPADITTPAMLVAYRSPFVSGSELYVLSPEA